MNELSDGSGAWFGYFISQIETADGVGWKNILYRSYIVKISTCIIRYTVAHIPDTKCCLHLTAIYRNSYSFFITVQFFMKISLRILY